MNNSHKNLYLVFAAGVAGVALIDFAGVFTALPFRGEAALFAAVAAGLLLIMVRDYSRRLVPLRNLARITRAPVPVPSTHRSADVIKRAA